MLIPNANNLCSLHFCDASSGLASRGSIELGLVGLWTAMSIAWLLATAIYLAVILFSDWQKQADAARKRNDLDNYSKATPSDTSGIIELIEK
jgi:Na+-driven multidrug efflux pump